MDKYETPEEKFSRELAAFVKDSDNNPPSHVAQFTEVKTVSVKFNIREEYLDALKGELQTKSNQETMNKLIREFTGWEDYDHKQINITRQRKKDEEMGRPTKPETEKKKSTSISLTDQEVIDLKGQFPSLGNGARFLMGLMAEAYQLGLLPDTLVARHMKENE